MSHRKTKYTFFQNFAAAALGVFVLSFAASCAGPPSPVRGASTARGATRGAVGGAAVGAISGGNAKKGAAAGAALGGVSGRQRAVRRGW